VVAEAGDAGRAGALGTVSPTSSSGYFVAGDDGIELRNYQSAISASPGGDPFDAR